MSLPDSNKLIRPLVRALHPYVPGEQPRIKGLIKLNTNENPCPPSPKVLSAIRAAVDGRLRLYPNPTAQALRDRLAQLHSCKPENIIIGNGSDELLAMAVRAFVEPAASVARAVPGNTSPRSSAVNTSRRPSPYPLPIGWGEGGRRPGEGNSAARAENRSKATVQFFQPSYSLYPVLAEIHGSHANAVRLHADFNLPSLTELRRGKQWDFRAALSLVTTPNAPSGRGFPIAQLEALCQTQKGLVLLDEAYVDFADENAMPLALKYPHVLVARTFSKAYSLCFQRVGYLVGHPALIGALDKIRDSYNVNGLGQVAALATLDELPWYRANFKKIIATREKLGRELAALGFAVFPSQTNFILVRPPQYSAEEWLQRLRERKILVRWFSHPSVREYLRITIGTPEQAAALVKAAKAILWTTRR
jgi:histidinol-phosphate aminotransferase